MEWISNWHPLTFSFFQPSRFRHSLMTWGDKFTAQEVDDAFAEFTIEGGMIDATHLKGCLLYTSDAADE